MLVLVAGGPASGKSTVCKQVAEQIKAEDDEIKVEEICMKAWQQEAYGPGIDFEGLLAHLESFDGETVLLVHGKYALFNAGLRAHAALKVFVECDSDDQLIQWILRDKDHREVHEIMDDYLNKAKPEFAQHISDTKRYADVLLPKAKESPGVEVISMNIVDRLRRVDDGSYALRSAKKIDLRKELFEQLDDRYYAAT